MVGYRVVTYQLWENVGKITFFNPGKIDVYQAVLFLVISCIWSPYNELICVRIFEHLDTSIFWFFDYFILRPR